MVLQICDHHTEAEEFDENHKESIYVHEDTLDAPDGFIGDNQHDLGSEKSYGLVIQNCDHNDTHNIVRDDLDTSKEELEREKHQGDFLGDDTFLHALENIPSIHKGHVPVDFSAHTQLTEMSQYSMERGCPKDSKKYRLI